MTYPGAQYDETWQSLVFPEDYTNPEPAESYNLVVMGAGTAGLVTAMGAAGLGARVALIEAEAMGGDCLNVGCVPSKALLAAASGEVSSVPDALDSDQRFDKAMAWLREVRAGIAHHDSVERFSNAGIDVFLGRAVFNDEGQITLDDHTFNTRTVVIATGASPIVPRIPGLEEANPLTNQTIFDLQQRPQRLAVIGGGAIGCELSQAFARLGVEVTLVEAMDRLLAGEDPDTGPIIQSALRADGVKVILNDRVSEVQSGDGAKVLRTESGAEISADQILVAIGQAPNTDGLNLEAAGVDFDKHGIDVDDKLRTSNKNIYAAGDICSQAKLTHNADAQARIVIENALFIPRASTDKLVIPRCTYTRPEVAQIGLNRVQAEKDGTGFKAWRKDWADMDRAITDDATEGYVEILTEPDSDTILGATLVGEHAGELLAPLALMIEHGQGLSALGNVVLPYPTRSEVFKRLSDEYNKTRLTPLVANLMKKWLAWRR